MVAPSPWVPVATTGPETPALRFADDGVSIDAGDLGSFTLRYPAPGANQQKPLALIEKNISGNSATLKYQGGGAIDLRLGSDGEITLSPTSLPPDVKTIGLGMLVDFAFGQGGTWKAGNGAVTKFPAVQPANPNLYQGHPSRFTLTGADGRSLTIDTPAAAFVQLQDNRAWQWKIFAWWMRVPYEPRTPFHVRLALSGTAVARTRVDAFGQSVAGDYAGKIASEAELTKDTAAEKQWLGKFSSPKLDEYGGLPGSGTSLGLEAHRLLPRRVEGSEGVPGGPRRQCVLPPRRVLVQPRRRLHLRGGARARVRVAAARPQRLPHRVPPRRHHRVLVPPGEPHPQDRQALRPGYLPDRNDRAGSRLGVQLLRRVLAGVPRAAAEGAHALRGAPAHDAL